MYTTQPNHDGGATHRYQCLQRLQQASTVTTEMYYDVTPFIKMTMSKQATLFV